ncbi:hypothetical protein [Aureibaculum conchae]|uniref:hypothetical protein n=1 Tax=Aureibaculum sp. 2308TA14-22 TaxID=3108392 RepID=UPI00339654F1
MKFLYFLLFLLSITLNLFSQTKKIIYVDEKFEKIDFKSYTKKLNSELFLISMLESDTAIFKKLRFKEYFGSLGKKKAQLNKLYQQRYTIDSTKTWLIHYTDSLPDVTKMPKESSIQLFDSKGRKMLMSNSEYDRLYNQQLRKFATRDSIIYKGRTLVLADRHIHVSSYLDYKESILKEIKRYKKYKSISILHFYNINKGFPVHEIKNFWVKDENEILKKSFSDGQLQYKFLLIYPNGDFYASHYFKRFSDEKKLFNHKRFKKLKKKWLRKVERLN